MRTFFTVFTLFCLLFSTGAQTTDYLQKSEFQKEKKKLTDGISSAKKQASDLKKVIMLRDKTIDSLQISAGQYQIETARVNDSLSSLNQKVTDLQTLVNQKKATFRIYLIIVLVILLILVIVALYLIFALRKKTEGHFAELLALEKKTEDKLEAEIRQEKEELRSVNEQISRTADDLKNKINSGIGMTEKHIQELDQNLGGKIAQAESKAEGLKPEVGKIKEGVDQLSGSLKTLKSSEEGDIQELKNLNKQLEKKLEEFMARQNEELKTLKTRLDSHKHEK
jgi:septal ring factor EnvC (AmiA/AmiB activator)